jgi:hypothetical protein
MHLKLPTRLLLRFAPCLAAAVLLTGCVGAIPQPFCSKTAASGRQIKPADVAFIHPGVTTRAEVVSQLGTEYAALPKDRAFAYSWTLEGGGGIWWYCIVVPPACFKDSGTWTGGWRSFFVAFDDRGVVTATAFKHPSPRHPIHEHLYAWVDKLAAAPAAKPGGAPSNPPPPCWPAPRGNDRPPATLTLTASKP